MPQATDDGETGPKRPHPVDVHVGMRLRIQRQLLGMSQEKLGEMMGLTFQQIQKYEKGSNRIGASRLYLLSKALSVEVAHFFEGYGDTSAVGLVQTGLADEPGEAFKLDFLNTREGLELNRAFVSIDDPRIRKSLIDLIKSVADRQDGER